MLIQHETALDATSDQDEVHGFVVRDIFSRSKLGQRVLSEIWELVESGGRSRRQKNIASRARTSDLPPAGDKKRRGRLKRHEFVVGLWLVDQCLKGRKLPLSVRDSVWDSAKVLMSGLRTR